MTDDYSGSFEPSPEDPQGVLGLPQCDVHPALVEKALRSWAANLNGADGLKRASQREQAVQELRARGVTGAAKLVDAAMASTARADDGSRQIVRKDEPWSSEVDGKKALAEIRALFLRYLVLPDHADVVMALWIIHTFAFDAADTTPYVAFLSPTKRCGKSRALELIRALASKAISADNLSAAAAYRIVEKYHPTLIADEVDTYFAKNDELRGMFNSGYRRGGQVLRCEGDNLEPKAFSTFAPKALAMIGELDGRMATTGDRSIYIRMRRKGRGEVRDRLQLRGIDERLSPVRQRCARWAEDNLGGLVPQPDSIPDVLDDRAQDIWAPLIAIADIAGGPWPKLSRAAAVALSGDRDDDELGVVLIGDIRDVFVRKGIETISTEELIAELVAIEDHPWATYNYKAAKDEKHISSRQLARLVKPFGVSSRTFRQGFRTPKGYRADDFSDAFERYTLGPNPRPSASSTESPGKTQRNSGLGVADVSATELAQPTGPRPGNRADSKASARCCSVADRHMKPGDVEDVDLAQCPRCGRESCPGHCEPEEADLVVSLDSKAYRLDGREYRAGATLPDGRIVIEVADGIPILQRKPGVRDDGR